LDNLLTQRIDDDTQYKLGAKVVRITKVNEISIIKPVRNIHYTFL